MIIVISCYFDTIFAGIDKIICTINFEMTTKGKIYCNNLKYEMKNGGHRIALEEMDKNLSVI